MPSAQNAVTIARPVDEVFNFVADGTNAPRWRPGVLDIALVSGHGVGAVYRQGVKGPGGRRIAADYEITEYEPNHRLAFKAIAGPVMPTGEFRFAATDGGTHLSFSLDAQISGWKRFVMSGPVQTTMNAEMQALERLKSVLEG